MGEGTLDLEKYVKLAEEDYMTGVFNRRGGIAHISNYIKDNPGSKCAFIILDGDYFKKFNNAYGHQYGDQVIVSCANEIKRRFSDKGIIVRLGGDEFVVFYKNTDENEIRFKLDEFLNVCRKANILSDKEMQFTFSIGVAMFPDNGDSFETLLASADEALFKAKYDGRACYRLYQNGMNHSHRTQFMFDMEELSKGMPGGFFVYRADGDQELLYVSDSLLTLYKYSSKDEFMEGVRSSFRGMVHPDDYEWVDREIHKQQFEIRDNVNKMDYVRYRIICKDGTVKQVDDFGHLVYDENYGMVYYVFLLDLDEYIFRDRIV